MKKLIKLEYMACMLLTLYFYIFVFNYSIWLLIILLFVPDVSMVGYVANTVVGAFIYNVFHSIVLPVVLLVIGHYLGLELLIPISLILIIHISLDRIFGYGLKYKDNFKHTHLGRM